MVPFGSVDDQNSLSMIPFRTKRSNDWRTHWFQNPFIPTRNTMARSFDTPNSTKHSFLLSRVYVVGLWTNHWHDVAQRYSYPKHVTPFPWTLPAHIVRPINNIVPWVKADWKKKINFAGYRWATAEFWTVCYFASRNMVFRGSLR